MVKSSPGVHPKPRFWPILDSTAGQPAGGKVSSMIVKYVPDDWYLGESREARDERRNNVADSTPEKRLP